MQFKKNPSKTKADVNAMCPKLALFQSAKKDRKASQDGGGNENPIISSSSGGSGSSSGGLLEFKPR